MVYALTSTNYSGVCASIRWYVPLLAPEATTFLVLLLRYLPRHRTDLFILTSFGFIIGLLMWWKGPWMTRMVPGFWFIQAGAFLTWLGWAWSVRKSEALSPLTRDAQGRKS